MHVAGIFKVVITGTGFITEASQNAVTFEGVAAVIESVTQSQITVFVPQGFTVGNLQVSNANGSAERFLNIAESNFSFKLTPNSAPKNFQLTNPGQIYPLCFDGTENKNISLLLENVGLNLLNIKIISPSEVNLVSQNYTPTNGQIFIDKKFLTESGVYLFKISSPSNQTGAFTASLFEFEDAMLDISPDAVPVDVSIDKPGKDAGLNFIGEEGAYVLDIQNVTVAGFQLKIIRNSDGQTVQSLSLPISNPIYLNAGYSIFFDPSGANTGAATFSIAKYPDITDSLETDGTPKTINFLAGQNAKLSFTATAGQNFNLQVSNVSARPAYIKLIDPAGQESYLDYIGNFYSGTTVTFTTQSDGNYTIFYDLSEGVTGSATFSLNLLIDTIGTLVINDPAATFTSTSPGQPFRINFAGNQGQRFYLKATTNDFYHLALTINKPDGTELLSIYNFSEERVIDINNLPDTGNYTIYLQPNFSHQFGDLTLQAIDNNVFISNTNYEYINAYFYSVSFNDLQTDKKTESSVSKERSEKEKETPAPNSANLILPTTSYFYNGTAGEQFSFSPNQVQNQFNFTGGTMTIYKPDGTVLDSAPINSGICNVTLPEDGVYQD